MELMDAIGKSIFHSIASFNNSGIDILGSNSLISYKNDVYLNLITSFFNYSWGSWILCIT